MTHELASQIFEQVSDSVEDLDESDVQSLVEDFREYGVPEDEIERSVLRRISNDHDVDVDELLGTQSDSENNMVDVGEIEEMGEDEWVSMRVEFYDEWDPAADSMTQQGLLGDETGTVKFTSWDDSNPPELEEGETYEVNNVVTTTYKGRTNVKFTKNTEVEPLDEDIDVQEASEKEVQGALVDVQSGSGLIKRCTEEDCTRVLNSGKCREHGDVEGEFDLRIKAVIDDGVEAHEVIVDRELTEELTGTTLEDAKDIAMETLEKGVVEDQFSNQIVGRYYRVEGPQIDRYIVANSIEQVSTEPDVESLLIRGRSM